MTTHSATSVLEAGEAIDAYLGYLARKGRKPSTLRSYRRLLNDFIDGARVRYVHELSLRHYERFLDRWVGGEPSTLASGVSLVRNFSRYLWKEGYTPVWIAEPLERPIRKRYEDLDVVTVSRDQAAAMLMACDSTQEFLCVSTALYTGARRAGLAALRRADVDLRERTIRILEKGEKVGVKTIPDEYAEIIEWADGLGTWAAETDYLIPNRRAASVKRKQRSDKVIWETVRKVADRAGIKSHVHALRAAFAVQFDEQHPGENFALQDLLGHARIETTLVYLRRRDKVRRMSANQNLSWVNDFGFSPQAQEAHTGFEPVSGKSSVPEPIQRKLDELSAAAKARRRAQR